MKNFLKKINKNSTVCIYGSGELGIKLKEDIEFKRKDLDVKFFIDSFADGEICGKKIIKVTELKEQIDKIDMVLIASISNSFLMKNILKGYNINNYLEFENIYKFKKKTLIEKINELKNMIISDRIQKQKFVIKSLATNKDKKIYKMVCEAREKKDCSKIEKYAHKNLKISILGEDNQYLNCINKNAIKIVLDIGGFNGYTSIIFQNEFPNVQQIYCFEPLYDNFKHKFHIFAKDNKAIFFEEIIKKSEKIEIVKFGAWDKKDTIKFLENSRNYGASRIEETGVVYGMDEEIEMEIKTVSIDDFVDEKKIERVDFIKMDIEGAEPKALLGAEKTILKFRPQLAICIYHCSSQYIDIPLYLINLLPNYKFHVRHHDKGFSETVLYAIPKELFWPYKLK